MQNIDRLRSEIESLKAKYGEATFQAALKAGGAESNPLVIVGNCGLHPMPDIIPDAELYCATSGNLDFSSGDAVHSELRSMVTRLADKLRSGKWSKIYIMPFGHPVFSMHIKMTVYRVLGIDTSEIFHRGGGEYSIITADDRANMLSTL